MMWEFRSVVETEIESLMSESWSLGRPFVAKLEHMMSEFWFGIETGIIVADYHFLALLSGTIGQRSGTESQHDRRNRQKLRGGVPGDWNATTGCAPRMLL